MKTKVDPQEAKETFIQFLFAFDTITIHKRKGAWTVKIYNGSDWIVRESPNLFTAAFLAAHKVMSDDRLR